MPNLLISYQVYIPLCSLIIYQLTSFMHLRNGTVVNPWGILMTPKGPEHGKPRSDHHD